MNSYEQIRIMHTHRLVSDLSRADEKSVKDMCEKIDEKIDRYSNGDLDYAVDAVTLLWKLSMAAGYPPPAPEPWRGHGSPLPSRSPGPRCRHRSPLPSRSVSPTPGPRHRHRNTLPSHSLSPPPGPRRRPGSPPLPRFFSGADFFDLFPANCELVESALIKSIRTGMFFDRRYWARYSKTAKVLQPIHISSTVAGDKLRRINDRE